jgi:arylsulfatase A-like enzyme
VDASGGRGAFNAGTGNLRKNWPQEGTSTDWAMAPERDEDLPDHHAAGWAVERLNENHDQPFFLMVGFLRPHVPWYVPKRWFDLFDKEKITLPPYRQDDLDDVPQIARDISILKQMPRTEWAKENNQWRNIVHAYLACISFSDHQVGRVLDALDKSPHKDNTIIVLWSDHGYHIGEKEKVHKRALWTQSSRTPFLISLPGMTHAGTSCAAPVSLMDIYPTLNEICGLDQKVPQALAGHSLAPLLENPGADWPHVAVTSHGMGNAAVTDARYHFIRYLDGSEELYDHQNDPREYRNIAGNPEMNAVIQRLAAALPRHWVPPPAGKSAGGDPSNN